MLIRGKGEKENGRRIGIHIDIEQKEGNKWQKNKASQNCRVYIQWKINTILKSVWEEAKKTKQKFDAILGAPNWWKTNTKKNLLIGKSW